MPAKNPPMGWNSWDCYGASVDEKTVRRNAEYMAQRLKPFGWEYIVVDIQWSQPTATNHAYVPFAPLTMDAFGRLTPAEIASAKREFHGIFRSLLIQALTD